MMAEYSKEYAKITSTEDYDFSYKNILDNLENDHFETRICEGLGTFGVHKKNNIYYLILNYEGDLAEFSLFLKVFSENHEQKSKLK